MGQLVNKNLNRFGFTFVVLFLFSFTSCPGMSPGGGGGVSFFDGESGISDGEEGGLTGTSEGGSSGSFPGEGGGDGMPGGGDGLPGDGGGSGGGSIMEPVSIGAPSLTGPDGGNMLVAAADDSGFVPVVGFEGAVGAEYTGGDHVVAVSEEDLQEAFYDLKQKYQLAKKEKTKRDSPPDSKTEETTLVAKLFRKVLNWITPAYALTITEPEPTNPLITEFCDQEKVFCCPPASDGSFTCYPTGTNSSNFNIYLTDGENLSPATKEGVNHKVLWLNESPKDMVSTGDMIYSMTNGVAVKMQYSTTDSLWYVVGNYLESYKNFEVGGDRFDFDPGNDFFGVMNRTDGVNLKMLSNGNVTDLGITSTQVDATEYTAIKYENGNLMYGIAEEGDEEAYIYHALDGTGPRFDPDSNLPDWIQFIAVGDTEDDGVTPMTHFRTVDFAINTLGHLFVAYEGRDGELRFRMSDGTVRFGGKLPVNSRLGRPNIKALSFIDDDNVILLDDANHKVWVVRTDRVGRRINSNLSLSVDGIPPESGPVAVAFNPEKSIAFVLGGKSETIYALSIVPGNLPRVVGTVKLADFTPGKNLTFTPNKITYQDEHLFVGCKGIKSQLVIKKEDISPPSS